MPKKPARPAYRATKGAKTRERIVETAAALFAEHGYSGTALSDVMGRCHLTKGGFYAHFASKEDLYLAAVRMVLERERINYVPPPESAAPTEKLRAFLRYMEQTLSGDRPLGRLFLWMLLDRNSAVTQHAIHGIFHSTYDELSRLLRGHPHADTLGHSLLAVALLYDQIRARIMPSLVPRSTLQIDASQALEYLVEPLVQRRRPSRRS
ncbi:MAG TPA: TetR/AcrR family transcriptional regulator [Nevskiaceae bacterium]|nr:TetR/AcrR family transcriptional regulator [Nevskiaceae bacterium]